jgi:hypothetical protein
MPNSFSSSSYFAFELPIELRRDNPPSSKAGWIEITSGVRLRKVDHNLVGRQVKVKLKPRSPDRLAITITGTLADAGEDFVVIRTKAINKLVTIPIINIQTLDVIRE